LECNRIKELVIAQDNQFNFSSMQQKVKTIARVIKSTRNSYLVRADGRTINCTIRGRLAGSGGDHTLSVKVGDEVSVSLISESEGIIEKILPRRSVFSRAVEGKAYREHIVATNIDQVLIIMSTREPQFKSGLIDRYLVIARKNQIIAAVCINKIDLESADDFEIYRRCYEQLGHRVVFTSAKTGQGMEQFRDLLKDRVSLLVGHSGVGKSSLIKRIEPGLDLKIVSISEKTSKGRHTTSFVQLFPLSIGGYVIDTPGIRELGLWDIYRNELKKYFPEFEYYEAGCKFNDCRHLEEPGCAVKKAVNEGKIFEERYQNYRNIYAGLRNASHELIKPR